RLLMPDVDHFVPPRAGLHAFALMGIIRRRAGRQAQTLDAVRVDVGRRDLCAAYAAGDRAHTEVLAAAVVGVGRRSEDVTEEGALLKRIARIETPADRRVLRDEPQGVVVAGGVDEREHAGADPAFVGRADRAGLPSRGDADRASE